MEVAAESALRHTSVSIKAELRRACNPAAWLGVYSVFLMHIQARQIILIGSKLWRLKFSAGQAGAA